MSVFIIRINPLNSNLRTLNLSSSLPCTSLTLGYDSLVAHSLRRLAVFKQFERAKKVLSEAAITKKIKVWINTKNMQQEGLYISC